MPPKERPEQLTCFAITLNFGDAPERLRVPFDAILTFVDPSVEFGWRFETTDDDDDDTPPNTPDGDGDGPGGDNTPKGDAEVVSLDTFRRNH